MQHWNLFHLNGYIVAKIGNAFYRGKYMVEIYCSVSIRKERWDGGAGTAYICRKENSKFYQHTYLRIQAWIFHEMPIDESPLCCLNWTNELLTTSQACDFKCYSAVLCSLRVDVVGWLTGCCYCGCFSRTDDDFFPPYWCKYIQI